jgi:hypothetical protein
MADLRFPPRRASQLRDDIDRGAWRDKIPASDPAAAPLGTDAEAGGARSDDAGGAQHPPTGAPRPRPPPELDPAPATPRRPLGADMLHLAASIFAIACLLAGAAIAVLM